MKLLEKDDNIEVIVINIFGGILSCDMIASSILLAVEEVTPTKPIILRLKGTDQESAKRMIDRKANSTAMEEHGCKIYFCEQIDGAAELAVKLAVERVDRKR